MKKRNLAALLIASSFMMLTLAGCSVTAESDALPSAKAESEVQTDADENNAPEEDFSAEIVANKPSNPSEADASFEYNGKTITYSSDGLETIKTALGKPTMEDQAPSSDDPSDKLYTYGDSPNSIDLTEIGGKLATISIYDSSLKTARGISIGSTSADVIAAYGDAETTKLDGSTEIDYDFGSYTLIFFLDKSDKVKCILYGDE